MHYDKYNKDSNPSVPHQSSNTRLLTEVGLAKVAFVVALVVLGAVIFKFGLIISTYIFFSKTPPLIGYGLSSIFLIAYVSLVIKNIKRLFALVPVLFIILLFKDIYEVYLQLEVTYGVNNIVEAFFAFFTL